LTTAHFAYWAWKASIACAAKIPTLKIPINIATSSTMTLTLRQPAPSDSNVNKRGLVSE
jgi:hypothetical protein